MYVVECLALTAWLREAL